MNDPGKFGQRQLEVEDVYLVLHGEGFLDTLAWSPDGRFLAYVAATDGPSADIYVYDTQTSEVRRITDGPNQPELLGWSPELNRFQVITEGGREATVSTQGAITFIGD